MDSRADALEEVRVSEMIERVAQALCASYNHQIIWPREPDSSGIRERFHGMARAAIEALRKPTEAMTESAMKVLAKSGMVEEPMGADGLVLNDCYQAMIDAALTSRPKAGSS